MEKRRKMDKMEQAERLYKETIKLAHCVTHLNTFLNMLFF